MMEGDTAAIAPHVFAGPMFHVKHRDQRPPIRR
jgi:hypothetical protein